MSLENVNTNISTLFKEHRHTHPYRRAVIAPYIRDKKGRIAYSQLTYKQLDQESDCLAHGLVQAGIVQGTRTIVTIDQNSDFLCHILALFKIGAIPVLLDPFLNKIQQIDCMAQCRADALIGMPKTHLTLFFSRNRLKTDINKKITYGPRWFWGGLTYADIRTSPWKPFEIKAVEPEAAALIYFSLAAEGVPKCLIYAHRMIRALLDTFKTQFDLQSDEIDLPALPLFSILDILMGMSVVLPEMDNAHTASINPEKAVEAVINQGATQIFATSELMHTVSRYGRQHGIRLPSLKRVILTETPLPCEDIERFKSLLSDNAKIHMPFCTSVATPVASIDSDELLDETIMLSEKGYGRCIGQPIEATEVKLIEISDAPIKTWSDDLVVAPGEIGEMTVKETHTAQLLDELPENENPFKIKGNGFCRIRSGYLGWLDQSGRIWYCGRKADRVTNEETTLFTLPCEALFDNHSRVLKSVLIGVGPPKQQKPVICVELIPDNDLDHQIIQKELLDIADSHPMTQSIKTILIKKSLPMTTNHHICRKTLLDWAEKRI